MSKNDKNIEEEIKEEIKEEKSLEDELDELDEFGEPKEVTVMDMLNRIVVCLIVIAIILAINTTVLIFKNNSTSNNESSNTNNPSSSSGNSGNSGTQTSNYDTSMMEELDLSKALKLFDEKDKTYVLYIGRPDCSACVSYLPTLQEAQENLGYKTQYLNLNNVDSKSDNYTKFTNKLSVKYTMTVSGEEQTETFGKWMGYTPMTIIIKNGKMVDGEIGAISYTTLTSLLKNNGIE